MLRDHDLDRRTWLSGRPACVLLATALFAAAGCGLSSYEAKMQNEVTRSQKFDDDNANLADAADTDDEIFFRPPRGIKKTPEKDLVERVFSVFTPSAPNPEVQAVWLAVTGNPKDDLEARVWNALHVSKMPLKEEKVGTRSGHKPVAFDKPEGPIVIGDTRNYLYFYKQGNYEVAIVYKVEFKPGDTPPERLEAARKLMDYSLSTVAVGDKAKQRRKEFRPR